MFAMTVSACDGECAGFLGVPGIFTGDGILMMSWVAGVISLIQTTLILFMTLKLFGGGYVTSIISIAVYTRRRLNQGHWFGRLGKALAGSAFVSYGLKMALTS
jgi:threonine/homoserine/homoserine lactone efflux protein